MSSEIAGRRYKSRWEIDQSPWDIAAGGLIVEEAVGRMTDYRGGAFDIYDGETVASNGRIHDRILAVLAMPGGMPTRHRPPCTGKQFHHQDAKAPRRSSGGLEVHLLPHGKPRGIVLCSCSSFRA